MGFQIQWGLEYHTLEYLSFEVQISNGLVLEWSVIAIAMVLNILKLNNLKSKNNGGHFVQISNGFRQNGHHFAQNGTPSENQTPNFGKYFDLVLLFLVSTLTFEYMTQILSSIQVFSIQMVTVLETLT